MKTVSVTREFDTPAGVVREAIRDAETFLRAVGFEVDRDGETLTLTKSVAVKQIELRVRLVDDDATLSYEQVEGVFGEMRTRYTVTETDGGCSVTTDTRFEPPTSGFGTFVTESAVQMQRRNELADLETFLEERSSTTKPAAGVADPNGEGD
ncbi:SRPBCC family protein [Halorussus salinisoli]|uniref:SRPBCC family protein n=1 Tax=Halorussus salinisoli TaxID=2558242 RepID=UPI0010C1D420|nr:SRPBCC family protein [Halorussus salinisoli]